MMSSQEKFRCSHAELGRATAVLFRYVYNSSTLLPWRGRSVSSPPGNQVGFSGLLRPTQYVRNGPL